jgi:hypothetical protein
MTDIRVIGVDPGPIPGIVVLDVVGRRLADVGVLQCTANIALELIHGFVRDTDDTVQVLVQVERYVSKGRLNAAQRLTADMVRDVLGDIEALVRVTGVQRPAVAVKPWATDARLEAAGLLEAVKGMRHARDAARHALFCAVHDAGVPDPLSKEFHR